MPPALLYYYAMFSHEETHKAGAPWALLLIAAALAIAAYASSVGGGFINWDDPDYVEANSELNRPLGSFIPWAFTSYRCSNWHPLTWLTYKLDHSVWGLDPRGYRATNLALHALNTILAGLLFWRLFRLRTDEQGAALAAALAAMIFAVHPLHVESVAWISERKDLLYAVFWLASLMAYVSYAGGGGKRAYIASLALFALSIMSKPMAITLSAVIVALDFYPLRRKLDFRTLVIEKLPFFAVSAFSAYMTVSAHVMHETLVPGSEMQYIKRSWVAAKALVMYIANFFAPVGLVPFYPMPKTVDWATPEYLLPAAALAALVIAAIALIRRAPVLAASLAAFVIMLSPTLNIIQMGEQSMADRYMYVPLLCPIAALAAGAVWLWRTHCCRRAMTIAFALLALALSGLTLAQASIWKSDSAFWPYIASKNPDDPATMFYVAKWNYRTGNYEESARLFRQSIKGQPYFPSSYHFLASSLYGLGRYDEAVEEATRGIMLERYLPETRNPNFTPYSWLYLVRGMSHHKMGRLKDAEADYMEAIRRDPQEPKAHYDLMLLYNESAMYKQAEAAASEAIRLLPNVAEFYAQRANARLRMGKQDEAMQDYQRAQALGAQAQGAPRP